MPRIKVTVDGRTVSVDRRDVLAWAGVDPPRGRRTAAAERHGPDYVAANPRPEPDAQGAVNVPARQRTALLRRLAAGPATRTQLLGVMRDAAGYVGGDDWRNRLDELRGRGRRGGGHTPLPIAHDEATDTYRLTESFALLDDGERAALARVKGLLHAAGAPVRPGRVLLDGMLPDIAPAAVAPAGPGPHAPVRPDGTVDVPGELVLHATQPVREALEDRELVELTTEPSPVAGTPDRVELRGRFDPGQAGRLLDVLLAWTGAVRILAPDWLAVAHARRCLHGLVAQLGDLRPHPPDRQPPDPSTAADRLESLRELSPVLAQAADRLRDHPTGR